MKKIFVPYSIRLSNIAIKQIEAVENNNDLKDLTNEINKCLNFILNTPNDLLRAKEQGMNVEKISEREGKKIISIHISKTDSFAYSIDNQNNVTIISALNHYVTNGLKKVVIYEDELATEPQEKSEENDTKKLEVNKSNMQLSKTHATEISTIPMPFDIAQNYLAQLIDKSGAFINGSIPVIGRLKRSYGYGKVIGVSSFDRKVFTRIDWDPEKGYHFNFVNYHTNEKIAIIINNMTQTMYENYIDRLTARHPRMNYSKSPSYLYNEDYLENDYYLYDELEEDIELEEKHNFKR